MSLSVFICRALPWRRRRLRGNGVAGGFVRCDESCPAVVDLPEVVSHSAEQLPAEVQIGISCRLALTSRVAGHSRKGAALETVESFPSAPALHNEDYGRLWFRQVATVSGVTDECTHIPTEVPDVQPHSDGCEDCLRIGSSWIHLRMCAACGHVGCCDQSEHHHARQHHAEHPDHVLIRSLEPGEAWWYCWIDDLAFELDGVEALRPG